MRGDGRRDVDLNGISEWRLGGRRSAVASMRRLILATYSDRANNTLTRRRPACDAAQRPKMHALLISPSRPIIALSPVIIHPSHQYSPDHLHCMRRINSHVFLVISDCTALHQL